MSSAPDRRNALLWSRAESGMGVSSSILLILPIHWRRLGRGRGVGGGVRESIIGAIRVVLAIGAVGYIAVGTHRTTLKRYSG